MQRRHFSLKNGVNEIRQYGSLFRKMSGGKLQNATCRAGKGEVVREFEIPEEMTPLQKWALKLIDTITVPGKQKTTVQANN